MTLAKQLDTIEIKQIISAALEDEESLTSWEWDFINNMAEKEEVEYEHLSEAQLEALYQIGEKV